MQYTLTTTSALLSSLLFVACATSPLPTENLLAARSTLRSAEADPAVLAHAPLELKKATESLNRANTLQADGAGEAEVNSAAHVASQQAKTAMAVGHAKGSDAAITVAEVERERARADKRSAETLSAQSQTRTAEAQTTVARQQTAMAEQQTAIALAGAAEAEQQAAQLRQRLNALQATQTERGMLVTLGDVLFETGRATVLPSAQASLRRLADFLQQYPTRRILIEGHTDSVGTAGSNEALSQHRADAVKGVLMDMGVASQRAATAGYGEAYPVADNRSDTNRALNRRVEVYIADNDQPVRTRR